MKTSYLIAALVLLIIVLSFSYYFSIKPTEGEEEGIIEEAIEEIIEEEKAEEIRGVEEIEDIGGEKTAIVEIKEWRFVPAEITISRGTTVTWVNNHDKAHKIVDYRRTFYGERIQPGENYSFTFEYAGVYEYFDAVYPKTLRNGKITVVENMPITGSFIGSRGKSGASGVFAILAVLVLLTIALEINKEKNK